MDVDELEALSARQGNGVNRAGSVRRVHVPMERADHALHGRPDQRRVRELRQPGSDVFLAMNAAACVLAWPPSFNVDLVREDAVRLQDDLLGEVFAAQQQIADNVAGCFGMLDSLSPAFQHGRGLCSRHHFRRWKRLVAMRSLNILHSTLYTTVTVTCR